MKNGTQKPVPAISFMAILLKSCLVACVWGCMPFIHTSAFAQTAIGGLTPDPSAILDIISTNRGVLFPRMTTTERGLISNPATGLMIFNTTTGCLEINLGAGTASWQSIICTPGSVSTLNCGSRSFNNFPLVPGQAATNQSISIPYTGGNGFDHNGQVVQSTGVTGLTATLAAGTLATGNGSLTYSISGTPSAYGTAVFAINIAGKTCSLEVPLCGAYVTATDWKVFSCYNLGAVNTAANPLMPSWEIIGGYWQWGRAGQAAPGPAGLNGEIPNDGSISGWDQSNPPDNSWLDTNPMNNNPCPAGFRVPTSSQWDGVRNFNTQSNEGATWNSGPANYSNGKKFGPGLFLPAAGNRSSYGGWLQARGQGGYYWSSTAPGAYLAAFLNFDIGNSYTSITGSRANGFSLRCMEE